MPSRPGPYSPLERGILTTLLYFDVFDHPLSAEEIVRFAPVPGLTSEEVAATCRGTSLRSLVGEHDGFFFVSERPETTVQRRREREAAARQLWPVAAFMVRMISRFPFVRGVFVSGELAKGVAGPDSDIDYLILTAERRLWVARSLLILFKKVFLLDRKRYFCLNHFQTIGHLEVVSKSYYAAVEIATLRPMSDRDHLRPYLDANPWIERVLPNAFASRPVSPMPWKAPTVQRLIETLFPPAATDRFDEWLRTRWERLWVRRYPSLTPDERAHRFACTPVLSTAYGTDIADRIESAWNARLTAYGLSQPRKITA